MVPGSGALNNTVPPTVALMGAQFIRIEYDAPGVTVSHVILPVTEPLKLVTELTAGIEEEAAGVVKPEIPERVKAAEQIL